MQTDPFETIASARVSARIQTRACLWLLTLLLLATVFLPAVPAWAGQVSKGKLEQHLKKRFGDKYVLGEQLTDPKAWPLFLRDDPSRKLAAWVFESVDVERVRGYSGKPINMLVTLAPNGRFIDVTLVKHHEPLFKSRSGKKLVTEFIGQYNGLSIDHEIQVLAPEATPSRTVSSAQLHGILRGTVTASAIDQSIMWAAVKVVEAHLSAADLAADTGLSPRRSRHRRLDWAALKANGLVQQFRHSYADIAGLASPPEAALPGFLRDTKPDSLAVDFWAMPIALPAVGQSLLEARPWQILQRKLKRGRDLILMLDSGGTPLADADDKQSGARNVPALVQGGKVFALERTQFTSRLRPDDSKSGNKVSGTPRLFQTEADSGFDIAEPFSIVSQVVAGSGQAPIASFNDSFVIPQAGRWLPRQERPSWMGFWAQKRNDLIVLAIGLLVLTAGLIAQRRLTLTGRRLSLFRNGYLLFTLVFVGWYAQGQLTIVTLLAAIQALLQGEGVGFMMADPMAVVLWGFTLITLFVWGRGTFCGWLCPFGAFQELINNLATRLGLRRRQLHSKVNNVLRGLKYGVLAVLVGLAVTASPLTDSFVEVEPFKTAISLSFQRSWPYVLWALACLALSLLVYRGYCRYLCPLGAALALFGRVRLFNWIPRRDACGTPCQTCRFRCTYQAISPVGKINYAECFQCLDCVAIHQDEYRCMPLIVERKKAAKSVIPIKAHV